MSIFHLNKRRVLVETLVLIALSIGLNRSDYICVVGIVAAIYSAIIIPIYLYFIITEKAALEVHNDKIVYRYPEPFFKTKTIYFKDVKQIKQHKSDVFFAFKDDTLTPRHISITLDRIADQELIKEAIKKSFGADWDSLAIEMETAS